jgi:hypothetical protein
MNDNRFLLNSCCCGVLTQRDNILEIIKKGKGKMKEFKYKNNVYILDNDIRISKELKIYNEKGEKVEFPREEGTYIVKNKYTVKKGYSDIDIFDTEEEANELINEIFEELED